MAIKIWDNKDSKLPLIIENASWRFIHNFSDFKTNKGVFVFANSSHAIIYVGNTIKNNMVEAIAESIAEGKDSRATLVNVLYTELDKDAQLIANILIEKYAPKNNNLDLKPRNRIVTGTNRAL